jgi:hypothetical protein
MSTKYDAAHTINHTDIMSVIITAGPVAGFCEHGNELSASIKAESF